MADKKGNIFTRIAKSFGDVIAELKRVTWPTREKLTKTSAVVLLVIVFFAIFQDILPAWDTVKAVKGAEDLQIAEGATITADKLASAGVVVDGVTEKSTALLKMNLLIQIVNHHYAEKHGQDFGG